MSDVLTAHCKSGQLLPLDPWSPGSVCPPSGPGAGGEEEGSRTPALPCALSESPTKQPLWGSQGSILSLSSPPATLKRKEKAEWSRGCGGHGGGGQGPLQPGLRPPSLELSGQLFQQVWPQGGEWAARCPLSPFGPQSLLTQTPSSHPTTTQRHLLTWEGPGRGEAGVAGQIEGKGRERPQEVRWLS